MIDWFNKDRFKDYKELMKKAFPKSLEKDLNVVLEIIPINDNNIKLCDGNTIKVENLINESFLNIRLENEELTIPYRLYFNEPDPKKEKALTELQKIILNCIYLRHHNGYIRQKRLELLVNKNQYWVTPFKFLLLGEYVYEIVEVLDCTLDNKQLENYKKFIYENPKCWQQTESRMISYWNEYYRKRFPKFKDYIGKLLFDQIRI